MAVDEAGAVGTRARGARGGGVSPRASSASRSSGRTRCSALKREHLGIDEPTDVLSFPIDGAEPLPPGLPQRARRRRALPAGDRRRVALATRPRRAPSRRPRARPGDGGARARASSVITPRRRPSIFESFNFAIEGIIHVLRTQRNMRIHFGVAVGVLVAALVLERLAARADRAAPVDCVRPDRRDVQHRDRGRGRRCIDVVRPDGEAREGHRRGRRPHRGDQRDRGRLPRLLRSGRRRELAAARQALRCARRADADRARADDRARHRAQGVLGTRVATSRRLAVRSRRCRVRRLDGDHARARRHRAPLPRILPDADHGVARRADADRGRRPLDASRSPPGGLLGRARDARRSSRGSTRDRRRAARRRRMRSRRAHMRRIRDSTSDAPCCAATAASSKA